MVNGSRGPSRRTFVAASVVTVAGAGGVLGYQAWPRTTYPRRVPLYSATVAMGPSPEGEPEPGTDRTLIRPDQLSLLVPQSRVVQAAPNVELLLARERAMLAAAPEWTRAPRFADAARSALLDLHVLADGLPSPVAAWTPYWRFSWPRDCAFVAVAQALTGQYDAALKVLRFLQTAQAADGWFEARYVPGTDRSPDSRPRQLDGCGWALWACDRVRAQLPASRVGELADLAQLVVRSTDCIVEAISTPSGLPPATPDYWEVSERSPTLATCAMLAAGLESAVRLLSGIGRPADRVADALTRLDRTIQRAYGRYGFPRHPGRSDPDIGAAFLLPPFRDAVNEPALQRLIGILPRLRRPAGGLAPGVTWHQDGISWTPETATVAAVFARTGQVARAAEMVQWLADHRTTGGSYPEKVLETGDPAAVAPLAWTAAATLLAIEKLPPDIKG